MSVGHRVDTRRLVESGTVTSMAVRRQGSSGCVCYERKPLRYENFSRDLSGDEVAKLLERHFGYRVACRQVAN